MQKSPNSLQPLHEGKVRAAKKLLGGDEIHGRHVIAVCIRGGGGFHGKIHVKDGKFLLETMSIDTVREKMKKEAAKRPRPLASFKTAWSSAA